MKTSKVSAEVTKKDEGSSVENVKSLQTDQSDLDINLVKETIAAQKEKATNDEAPQKTSSETLSLESLEAKA